ncbi:MAG: MbcA/ParS/Xre antitoxin family protein [Gammaproteobacteria bacterium]|nr:MbcA/ParS/Xre antitoxin family protein [Gammaproteobacteria bacterium]
MTLQQGMDMERRVDLARTLMSVLRNWGLTSEQQINLLGLPEETRFRMLNKFTSGAPYPDDYDSLMRANYLLSIQNAVDSLFPHNAAAANYWMTTPSHYFANHTPLEIMLNEGLEGMLRVLNYLNGVEDWG